MAKVNTTQIARDLLGPSLLVYHQDLTTVNEPHLKIDALGAGDFRFNLDNHPGQNPTEVYNDKGLQTYVERGANTSTNPMGHHAVIDTSNIRMPEEFVLIATFVRPEKLSLIDPNQKPGAGEYAATILFDFDGAEETGASSRFKTDDSGDNPYQNLNVLGYQSILWPVTPERPLGGAPPIDQSLYLQVSAVTNPSVFTVVLYLKRNSSDTDGYAALYVGDKLAQTTPPTTPNNPFFKFTKHNLTTATVFDCIRVGVGTAGAHPPYVLATNFSASVYLTEFEIWKPSSIYDRDFRLRSSSLGAPYWYTLEEGPGTDPATHFVDSNGIALVTSYRDPTASSDAKYRHSARFKHSPQPMLLPDKFQLRATLQNLIAQHLSGTIPREGATGDTFEVALVLKSSRYGVIDVEFKMQTADKTASSGRGVRLFVGTPQERDFLAQPAFDSLYHTDPRPVFTLNAIINKDPNLESTAYLDVGGNQFQMARAYKIQAPFFELGLDEIRVLVGTSSGGGLSVSATLWEFEIIEME